MTTDRAGESQLEAARVAGLTRLLTKALAFFAHQRLRPSHTAKPHKPTAQPRTAAA
jgi:hypothetical protein